MQSIDARTGYNPRTSIATKKQTKKSSLNISLITIGMVSLTAVYVVTHILASLGAF